MAYEFFTCILKAEKDDKISFTEKGQYFAPEITRSSPLLFDDCYVETLEESS